MSLENPGLFYGLCAAGLVLFGIMYTLFRKALRFYRSTGS